MPAIGVNMCAHNSTGRHFIAPLNATVTNRSLKGCIPAVIVSFASDHVVVCCWGWGGGGGGEPSFVVVVVAIRARAGQQYFEST